MEQEKNIYDIIIVGSGPAGMTAAIYARRFNLSVLVLEYNAPGGAVINTETISNYPGFKNINGTDLAMNIYEQMMALNVKYEADEINEVKKISEKLFEIKGKKTYFGKSVIIATGTKNRVLGIESEKRFFYNGISWCAICDGPLYKGKDVCVLGGGNSALSASLTLTKFVNKVYLVHRREEFRGDPLLAKKVMENEKIELVLQANVISFNGNNQNRLESITLKQRDLERTIFISGCFEFIGRLPNTNFLQGVVDLSPEGYINVDSNFETSIKGVFACGDVVNKKVRQIATAINDGTIASLAASDYIG